MHSTHKTVWPYQTSIHACRGSRSHAKLVNPWHCFIWNWNCGVYCTVLSHRPCCSRDPTFVCTINCICLLMFRPTRNQPPSPMKAMDCAQFLASLGRVPLAATAIVCHYNSVITTPLDCLIVCYWKHQQKKNEIYLAAVGIVVYARCQISLILLNYKKYCA